MRAGLTAVVAVLALAACSASDARPVAVSTVATSTTVTPDALLELPEVRPSTRFVRLILPAAASRGVPRQRPRATPPVVRQPTGGPAEIIALIHTVFGAAGDSAVGVCRCESKFNQRAVSPGGANLGLMQVNRVHRARWERMGYSAAQMLEAEPNLRVAKAIYDEQGWRPWACRWAA